MSRIIIKNLPKELKEERIRNLFNQKGNITDISLKFTKAGVFRRFAFIGYKTDTEAQAAVKYFNKSFIDTTRIQVELAKDLTDPNKPRPWSRYSEGSSANNKLKEKVTKTPEEKDKKTSKASLVNNNVKKGGSNQKSEKSETRMKDLLGDLANDPEFNEFLEVHKNRKTKAPWANDTMNVKIPKDQGDDEASEASELDEDADDSGSVNTNSDDDDSHHTQGKSLTERGTKSKVNLDEGISDKDYLRSKIGKTLDDIGSDSGSESADTDTDDNDGDTDEVRNKKVAAPQKTQKDGSLIKNHASVKMRGLPPNIKEKQIKEFFKPLKLAVIRIPRSAKKHTIGVAFVKFSSDSEAEQALRRNKNFIGGKKVFLKKQTSDETEVKPDLEKPKPWLEKEKELQSAEMETVAESGRLFVRNLSYCCSENDLEKHFDKYGPLTETNLPIDSITKKVKGFAFITYMIPEHAVKALSQLDGTVFQGRMLHILPSKAKIENAIQETGEVSFKKKREAEKKSSAKSSHNWNTLFLGANAIADVMSEKYSVTKASLLDPEGKQSLGVRMALGETQIVRETRQFLTDHGVKLDSFSQASSARSKTILIAKNLPAATKVQDIESIFKMYGTLGRLVLPPTGVTALIEFTEPTEARAAFRKLAYSKFGHIPLYLEWAPMDVFTSPQPVQDTKTSPVIDETEDDKMETEEKQDVSCEVQSLSGDSDSEDDETTEPGSTLFVKNLNFDTTEETMKQMFSNVGQINVVTIAKKKNMKNPGKLLSMGYGFVEFKKKDDAMKALKQLQHSELDGHQIELKISERATVQKKVSSKKKQKEKKQKLSKILVRNIPFEAKTKEVKELFSVFGEIKTIRLPKKLQGTGTHRGFGFVDFVSKKDAKRAFNELCHSTHLYGRRLVLEWAETEENVEQIRKKTADHFFDDGVVNKKVKKLALLEDLKGSASP